MSRTDEEFQGIHIDDQRRNRRAIQVVRHLAERPTESLPGACRGWCETQTADRFFGNDAIEHMAILEPHSESTMGQMGSHRGPVPA